MSELLCAVMVTFLMSDGTQHQTRVPVPCGTEVQAAVDARFYIPESGTELAGASVIPVGKASAE